MRHDVLIHDPIEGEDDALTAELLEAFGELREEPEDFARGVRERIEEAGGEVQSVQRVDSRLPDFARRAAALLPPMLLPKGLVQLGLGGTTASKWSFKFWWPGLLAFPIISILMVFLTIGLGLRALQKGSDGVQRQDEREARYAAAAWWRRFWLPVGLVIGVSFYFLFELPSEGLSLMFSISTIAFLGVYSALSRAGLATRREVGRRAAQALLWLIGLSFQISIGSEAWLAYPIARWFVPIVLMTGGMTCLYLAQRNDPKQRIRSRHLLGAALSLVAAVAFLVIADVGQVLAEVEDVQQWLRTRTDSAQVDEVAQAYVNLELAGRGPEDLKRLRDSLRRRLDREYAQDEFNSLYAAAIIELGAFEDLDYGRLRDDARVERMCASSRGSLNIRAAVPTVLASAHFGALSAEQGARLADKVFANVDALDQYEHAESIQDAVQLLEAVGAGGRVRDLDSIVEQVLLATWAPRRDGKQGAFAGYRSNIARDEHGRSIEKRLSFVWMHATAVSVWLMERFGVPADVDLRALDAYLAAQSAYYPGSGISPYVAEAVASRALLHTLPEWARAQEQSEGDSWSWLIEWRALFAAILLAAFGVALTLRAPEESGSTDPGWNPLAR